MKKSNILHGSIVVVLCAILFVPLIFSGTLFFPYISGKNFAFRILVEIAGLLYAFLLLKDTSSKPRRSVTGFALLGFIAVMGIATLTSIAPFKSFWSNYERMEGYITMLHLGLYFVVLAGVFVTEKLWQWFFEISLFASLFVGGNALGDLGKGIERIYGSLGNSSYLGVYSLIHIFLALFLLFKLIERGSKNDFYWLSFAKYVGYALFNTYIMYQTGTRGSFVGLIAGVFVASFLLAFFEKERKGLRKTAVGIFTGMVVVVGLLGATKNTDFVKNSLLGRYASLVTFNVGKVIEEQGFGRTLIWNVALQGVKERPILGWGEDNFGYVFSKYYTPDLWGQEQWFDRAHNVFLDWLIAGGVLGLLAYLFLYIAFLWSLWKADHKKLPVPAKAILTGLLVSYFVHNLFVFDNLASYILFFALLGYGAYVSQNDLPEIQNKTQNNKKTKPVGVSLGLRYGLGSVALVLFVFVLYQANIKPYKANVTLLQALQDQAEFTTQGAPLYGNDTALENAYSNYDKALGYNTFGTQEIREQLAIGVQTAFLSASSSQLKQEAVSRVDAEYTKQLAETPYDPRPFSVYGGFLTRTGRIDQGIEMLQKAETLSPGKQTFKLDEGVAFINKGQYDLAFTKIEQAYQMATSNPVAVEIYAIAAIYDKKPDVFKALAKDRPDLIVNQKVIQAYVVTKQFGTVIPLLENYIGTHENVDPTLRIYLAAANLEIGNRVNALAALNAALVASSGTPQMQAELNYFINMVKNGATSLLR